MAEALVGVGIVVAVIAIMLLLAWVARRIRRRGSIGPAIGAAMAAYDQGVHVTAYESFLEMQAQEQRATPLPAPAEKKRPVGTRPVGTRPVGTRPASTRVPSNRPALPR